LGYTLADCPVFWDHFNRRRANAASSAQPYPARSGDWQRDRGAAAVIPPRRNAQPSKPTTAGANARNDALRTLPELEPIPPPESRRDKDALPETPRPTPDGTELHRQVAEVQIRIAILNGYTALGIPITKSVG